MEVALLAGPERGAEAARANVQREAGTVSVAMSFSMMRS